MKTNTTDPRILAERLVERYSVKEAEDLDRQTRKRNIAAALLTRPALGAATTLGAFGGVALEKALHQNAAGSGAMPSGNLVKKLRQATQLPGSISVRMSVRHPLQSRYEFLKDLIHTAPSAPPGIVAHEMGHASGRPLIPHIGTSILGRAGKILAPLATLGLAVSPDSPAAPVMKYGPAVLLAPEIMEEGRASLRALRALHSIGGKGAVGRGLLSLIPAFGTYLGAAATPIVASQFFEGTQKEGSAMLPRLKNFGSNLFGSNTRRAVEQGMEEINALPFMRRLQKAHSAEDLAPLNTYIERILKDPKALPLLKKNMPSAMQRTKGRQQLLAAMERHQGLIHSARNSARSARLQTSSGVALPTLGVAALSDAEEPISKTGADDSTLPAVGAAIAGSAPIAQGISSGALRFKDTAPRFKDVDELRRALRVGDVILTGDPKFTANKAMITSLGSSPGAYHASVFTGMDGNEMNRIQTASPHGGAGTTSMPLGSEHVTVRRMKNPKDVRKLVRKIRQADRAGDVVRDALSGHSISGSRKLYDQPRAIGSALKSFLPHRLNRALSKAPDPGSFICSNLVGASCPTKLVKGLPNHALLPHHLEATPELETVGKFTAKQTRNQRLLDVLAKASPWAVRGLIGAGLGYGAYKGIDALMGSSNDGASADASSSQA